MPRTPDQNPLLDVEFRIPFDQIRAEHVQPAVAEWLRVARERLDALAGGTELSYANTLQQIDVLSEPIELHS